MPSAIFVAHLKYHSRAVRSGMTKNVAKKNCQDAEGQPAGARRGRVSTHVEANQPDVPKLGHRQAPSLGVRGGEPRSVADAVRGTPLIELVLAREVGLWRLVEENQVSHVDAQLDEPDRNP